MAKEKLKSLDGIRGIMAIVVVFSHFVLYFFPHIFQYDTLEGMERLAATSPLAIFFNGGTAVQYFHVLIGFLVARSILIGKKMGTRDILEKCVNRYIRLMPMVAVTTFLTYLSMEFGLMYNQKVGEFTNIGSFCNFEPSFGQMLLNALYLPFVESRAVYVETFWTVYYELWGYIVALLACFFFRGLRFRRIGYIVVAMLLWTGFMPFFIGVFFGDLCYEREKYTAIFSKWYVPILYTKPMACILLIAGVYMAACPLDFVGWYAVFGAVPKLTPELVRAFGAAMVIFTLAEYPAWGKMLEGKVLLFLGKISFSIYAAHLPFMLTMQSWLFYHWMEPFGYDKAAWMSFGLTLPVILLAGYTLTWLTRKIKPIQISEKIDERSKI